MHQRYFLAQAAILLLPLGGGLILPPPAVRAQARNTASQWVTPRLPFPEGARRSDAAYEGILHLRTDERGQVIETHMDPSTGSSLVDESSMRFVRARWHGPPNITHSVKVRFFGANPPKGKDPRIRLHHRWTKPSSELRWR